MNIHVTQKDIDKGTRGDPGACAVALALTRETGQYWMVDGSFLRVCKEGAFTLYRATPPEVSLFIRKFDGLHPVAPFTFKLNLNEVEPFEFELEF